MKVTVDQIKSLAPNVRTSYLEALKSADEVLNGFAINHTPLRLAHFMAQILHETGGFTIFTENMNYSAERMMVVWPSRFKTLADAALFAHNPKALANKVYNGRMGNRVGTDDGFNFIGHGFMQLTGREAYKKYGEKLGIDLVGDSSLALDPRYSLRIAAAEWSASGCNAFADNDDLNRVTRAINGGLTGLASRREWLRKTKAVWH